MLQIIDSKKFVVRFWLHWGSLERFKFHWRGLENCVLQVETLSRVIYIQLEGFKCPFWGLNPLEGKDILNPSGGIINPQDGYLNSSSEILNIQEGYLNPSSGIINPKDENLNPFSWNKNLQEWDLNPSSGISNPRKDIWIPPVEF